MSQAKQTEAALRAALAAVNSELSNGLASSSLTREREGQLRHQSNNLLRLLAGEGPPCPYEEQRRQRALVDEFNRRHSEQQMKLNR